MDSKTTTRAGRDGVSVPRNNTAYRCFSSQQQTEKVKVKVMCKNCKTEFLVPTCTTSLWCPKCRTNNAPNQGQGQSSDGKIRNGLMKSNDRVASGSRNGYEASLSAGPFPSLPRRYSKRAVLCGVTYTKRKFRLKGTVSDVRNMKKMLIECFDFPSESILVLTEQQPDILPTKENILKYLKWLVSDCRSGDSLVFYFSGHGLQQPDLKGDEIDGYDETVCPVDFMREGMIVDDDINSLIVSALPNGVTLHAIVDTSHSGTILDLTYVYDLDNCTWDDNKPPAKEPQPKHTSGGLAICLSACRDNQMATDTTAFGGKGMNGMMTFLLTKIVKENPGITYGGLLDKMNEEIEKVIQRTCRPSFWERIFPQKISQKPILSSSEKFDIYQRAFKL